MLRLVQLLFPIYVISGIGFLEITVIRALPLSVGSSTWSLLPFRSRKPFCTSFPMVSGSGCRGADAPGHPHLLAYCLHFGGFHRMK